MNASLVLGLGGCGAAPAATDSPAATGPFVVEGIGPATAFVYRTEIEKDLARRVGPRCPNGFDVIDLVTRQNPGQMTAQSTRYRAIVECRAQ